ncbi:MAG: SWIM zinc finger family protein [Bacteroidota bacterium]
MSIVLKQFEQHIAKHILERGFSYYNEGNVKELELKGAVYQAKVAGSGTSDYSVRIETLGNAIHDWKCTCPYDKGPCKHIASTLYAILEEMEDEALQASNPKKNDQTGCHPKISLSRQINFIAEQVPIAELREFVVSYSKRDASFKTTLLSNFAHINQQESGEAYREQIQALIKLASAGERFLDYQASRKLGREMQPLVDAAQKYFDIGRNQSAIELCIVIVEEMVGAISSADDSSAYIGGIISQTLVLLEEMAEIKLDEESRILFVEACLKVFSGGLLSGWDWESDLVSLAVGLLKTEAEFNELESLINQQDPKSYYFNRFQELKSELLRRKGEN